LKSIQETTYQNYATCNTKLNQYKQRTRGKSGGGNISDKDCQIKDKN